MKKLIFLIICLFFLFIHIDVVKAEDDLVVTVDNDSFQVINDNVTIGGEVTIKVAIDSNSAYPLSYVIVKFTKPITKANTKSYNLNYNSTSGLYEGTIVIDNDWQNGEYIIEHMFFDSDDIGYTSRYNSKNPEALFYGSSNEYSIDLSNCKFTVYGTTADVKYPVINESSLAISNRQVIIGDRIKYSVGISDNQGIKEAYLWVSHYDGSSTMERIELNYNSITNLYEGYFNVDENTKVGSWKIYKIQAVDTNENTVSLEDLDISTYSVYNYGENPDSKLTIASLGIDNTSITTGETLNISLEAMNYFDIEDVNIYYRKNDSNELHMIKALFSKVNSTGSSNGLSWYYNNYIASLTFNEYGYNGKWTLDKIEIVSKRDNVTTIYNNELYEDSEYDLSSLNFETHGLIDDENYPIVNDYSIDKEYIYYNDKIKLIVNASDDSSGIKSVIANYRLPNGINKDYYLSLNNNEYVYEFKYDNQNLNGEYVINYLLIEDKAGNITKLTENISNLSFDFYNSITIIVPTLYPDTYTSYTLKALLADNMETKDVVWSSSNTSIASINASTGIMTTKNVGKVTITATATDGSGIYGTIDLIVTDAKVLLGQSTSLGTSNYIEYSSVVWKIEDKSILFQTGSVGSGAINGMYKHYVGVKGLKIGSTTLSLLTPSGDLILSSLVYVYNEISSITSETELLILSKNDTTRIAIDALYQDGSNGNKDIYYYSTDSSVVKVDQKGNVTAVSGGTANIVIYSKNSSTSLTIPVTVVVYSNTITVDSNNIVLNNDKPNHQIVYSVLPEDTLNKNVTFKSSDESIVTVTNAGMIQAVRNGNAIIAVSSDDGYSQTEIMVTVENFSVDVKSLSYEDISELIYTGNAIEPNIVIKDGDYILIKGTDYTIGYLNNINVGTAEIIVKGINNYRGTKNIGFAITQADLNIDYNVLNNTIVYDGDKHGISINIDFLENIIIKYKDVEGNYTLLEMPKYEEPGEYIISFELYFNENYKTIKDYGILTINKKNLTDNTQDLEIPYGYYNENTISVSIEESVYAIYYKKDGEEYTSLEPPTFTQPGSYTVEYKVLPGLPNIYNPLFGIRKVNIFGIRSLHSSLSFLEQQQILLVRNYNFSISDIFSKMDIFKNDDFIVDYEETNAQTEKSDKVSTNDYITFTYKGSRYNDIYLSILGDVNGDGEISPLDYVRIKNHIMGNLTLRISAELYAADLNEDGEISPLDYVRVKNYIMNGGV